MYKVSYEENDGQIKSVSTSGVFANSSEGLSSIEVEPSVSILEIASKYFVLGQSLTPRPTIDPWVGPFTNPSTLLLDGLPEGSTLTIENESGDKLTIASFVEPLVLTDVGVYKIKIDPAFPWMPFEQVVVVE